MSACTARRRVRLGGGTSGSNPLCSSGESANSRSQHIAEGTTPARKRYVHLSACGQNRNSLSAVMEMISAQTSYDAV
jgi:hypothetical protein